MRRPLIVLVAAFMLTALLPSAALAAKPESTINKITATVTGPGNGAGLCEVKVIVNFAKGKATSGWTIEFMQLTNGYLDSYPGAVTPQKNGVATQTFSDVRLWRYPYSWMVRAMSGDVTVTNPYYTSEETWTTPDACPPAGTVIATYP